LSRHLSWLHFLLAVVLKSHVSLPPSPS
jgi:hypothetical protein